MVDGNICQEVLGPNGSCISIHQNNTTFSLSVFTTVNVNTNSCIYLTQTME